MNPISSHARFEDALPALILPDACRAHGMAGKARPSPPRRGFTLIEVLVVIVIIAVLAAVLMTVSRRMISSSHSATCVSNLRQLSTAITAAASDYGYYPVVADDDKLGHKTQADAIGWKSPFMSCPAARFHGAVTTPGPGFGNTMSAYGMNPMVMLYSTTARPPVRPAQISRPSQVILAADGAQMMNPFPRALGYCARWFGTQPGQVENAENEVTEALVLPSGFWGDESQIPLRHNGTAHVVFVDGHVETIRRLGDLKEKNFYRNY